MSAAALSIVIICFCIVLFVTEAVPLVTGAMIGITLMATFKVCTFAEAFSGFASDTCMLVLGMIVLGNALSETGAAYLLGKAIVKLAKGSTRAMIAVSAAGPAFISAWMQNSAVTATWLSILDSVTAVDRKLNKKDIYMVVGVASTIGGGLTLVASTSQMIVQGILIQKFGHGYNFFDFTWVAGPIAIVMVLYYSLFGLGWGRKIWGDRLESEPAAAAPAAKEVAAAATVAEKEVNMRKVITVSVIFVATIVSIILNVLPSYGLMCIIAALLCVVTGCISQQRAIETMDWKTIGVLGGALGMAAGLDKSGGGKLIANAFVNWVGADASKVVVFVGIVVISVILTQFMSNTATAAMMAPIAIAICASFNMNPYSTLMGIVMASKMSFSTPLATPSMTMTLRAGYNFNDYWKYNLPFNIICIILLVIICPIMFPL